MKVHSLLIMTSFVMPLLVIQTPISLSSSIVVLVIDGCKNNVIPITTLSY